MDFIDLFLQDYITFYLITIYNNENNDFIINDEPHKIILLLLDLKFKELKEDKKPLQIIIYKILFLEANSKYIKDLLDLYSIIFENIINKKDEKEILFQKISNNISKNEIKYNPQKQQLIKMNSPYYILIKIFLKYILDILLNINQDFEFYGHYSYFASLEKCMKKLTKLDIKLKLGIKELDIINEYIYIYNIFYNEDKNDIFILVSEDEEKGLNINKFINNINKSLEILENNGENKFNLLTENLKDLIENIKEAREKLSDKIYYELIINILLNEIKRENNLKYKLYILNEFLLDDEQLFIKSEQLLKIILEDIVTPNTNLFQVSLEKLSNPGLNYLEDKIKNNLFKETLMFTFEKISILYIQNLIDENEKIKEKYKINIIIYLKSFFEKCVLLLETIYKDQEIKNEKNKIKQNINIKKLFMISFIKVYLRTFIDWINKKQLTKNSEIEEIIKAINGKERNNKFRDIIRCYIYKIIYNINGKDITKLFEQNLIKKFHLNSYYNFELFKEENIEDNFRDILFIEADKEDDENYKIFKKEYDLLYNYLNISRKKENELKKFIKNNDIKLDIFYSVLCNAISSLLLNSTQNENKIKRLKNIINNIFYEKEKLKNIFYLFLDISKNSKIAINSNIIEILQFSLRFCLNSDEISTNYDNIYFPLYSDEDNFNSYIPGNDIKESNLLNIYLGIKNFFACHPSHDGIYPCVNICLCNIDEENKEIFSEFLENNKNLKSNKKCTYCGEQIENNRKNKLKEQKSNYYKIFRNEDDLKKDSNIKNNINYITLENFYNKFIIKRIEKDSKGINIPKKSHFYKNDYQIRNLSQINYRLMNLILFSHLFINELSNNKEEIFKANNSKYLIYIYINWVKLKKLLEEKGISIYIFMNLIYKDLTKYINEQKQIEDFDGLLEVENKIENIINDKISKNNDAIKEFYEKNKILMREKELNNLTSIIKEINDLKNYKEEYYPYYKYFLYSDYLDKDFFRIKLQEEKKIGKYFIINLYLNKDLNNKEFNKHFFCFNSVIKLLHNQYSNKITRNIAKRIIFENTNIYKRNQKLCDMFLDIINSKIKDNKLTKESSLEYFLINTSNKYYEILKEIYKDFSKIQNDTLYEIINKKNIINNNNFEFEEINIQEAQKEDLIFFDFENQSEILEIFLMNTFKNIYDENYEIKYNNYNSYSIDFDSIEKILESNFIRNACLLKADKIEEMKYLEEDILDDGLNEFNKNIKIEDLKEKDKKEFIIFYRKKLENNLLSCLEVNEGIINIIKYVNKDFKRINNSKSLYNIINEEKFFYKVNDDLKEFLNNNNNNFIVSKLTNLLIYFEKLYFEFAIEEREEYQEKITEETKSKINEFYNRNEILITKEALSISIMKFLLNLEINKKNDINGLFEINDNVFDYLNNQFLWSNEIYNDIRFIKEYEELKNLGIKFRNIYDFYNYISKEYRTIFEKEKEALLGNINNEEEEKIKEEEIKKQNETQNQKRENVEKTCQKIENNFNLEDLID